MKILFIIPTYKPAFIYGGPTVVVSLLAESLVKKGNDVTVYTTTANGGSELDVETGKEVMVDGVKVHYFKRYTKDHSHISPGFWLKILSNVRRFDVVHLHSWWNPSIVVAAAICKLMGVRPVLSPHGMLCDYIRYSKNTRKKKLLLFFSKSLLRNTFLHVATPMEWDESQAILNGKWNGKIITNMVQLGQYTPISTRKVNSPFIIGFISRIEPKKGLDLLIMALAKVKFDYRLHIAGTGTDDYVNYLKQLAIQQGNADKIEWLGWKDNLQKFQFYSAIDLFALTSYNENFAVVVIESLSIGTPVFVSNHVGLSAYVKEKQLGWVTSIDNITEMANNLEQAYHEHDKQVNIRQTSSGIIKKDYDISLLTNMYYKYYKAINSTLKIADSAGEIQVHSELN